MLDNGYISHRLGIQSMDQMPKPKDDYGSFIKTLKESLDPNNILAPGRYEF
jgi:4-cresol dehydrogenase (hydroxylating) flavoprotein subunit